MTEERATYGTPKDKETAARVRNEALALRHVLTRADPEARAEACAKQADAALVLVNLSEAVARALRGGAQVTLPDVADMLERPALRAEADLLRACAPDCLDPAKGFDPDTLADAAARMLEDTAKAGELRRVAEAEALLAKAKDAPTAKERRALLDDALARIERAERATEPSLAEAWTEHLALMEAPDPGPDKVLRLQPCRGTWADWMNENLGCRRGMEPGETFILGGAPEAGKTSLAALFAVDALAAGCPVLFWQLELGRAATLEHLQAQRPDLDGWPAKDFWTRARLDRGLPKAWADLLTIPTWPEPEAEAVEAALRDLARKTERARRAGAVRHACNGLVIVDYAQRLTLAAKGPKDAGHEVLSTAASILAKAADESGACLLLLSQLNKQEQRERTADGTALAGADLARHAYRVALLQKADKAGDACKPGVPVAWEHGKGEARRLTWTKRRGTHYTEDRPPIDWRVFWTGGRSRALHGGDGDAKAGGLDWGKEA